MHVEVVAQKATLRAAQCRVGPFPWNSVTSTQRIFEETESVPGGDDSDGPHADCEIHLLFRSEGDSGFGIPGIVACRMEFSPAQLLNGRDINDLLHMTVQIGVIIERLQALGGHGTVGVMHHLQHA